MTADRRKRVAVWATLWVAFAGVVAAVTAHECAGGWCGGALDVAAFAGAAAVLIFACAVGGVVGLVYAWVFARAIATSVARAFTDKGSRGDYWVAAFVCSVVGAAGALLAWWSLDGPIGWVELSAAAVAGAVVMLYVWAIGASMVSVFKGYRQRRRLAERACRRVHLGNGRGNGGVGVVVHDPSVIGPARSGRASFTTARPIRY